MGKTAYLALMSICYSIRGTGSKGFVSFSARFRSCEQFHSLWVQDVTAKNFEGMYTISSCSNDEQQDTYLLEIGSVAGTTEPFFYSKLSDIISYLVLPAGIVISTTTPTL